MLIDCDVCAVRGASCADCVMTVLLAPEPVADWDDEELRALDVLAAGGLLPRLRLATGPVPEVVASVPAHLPLVPFHQEVLPVVDGPAGTAAAAAAAGRRRSSAGRPAATDGPGRVRRAG
jgi:hypothetical protein